MIGWSRRPARLHFVFLVRVRVAGAMRVIAIVVVMLVQRVAVVVVVHQFFWHIGEQFARRRRAPPGPFDAALLARGGEEVLPR